MKPSSFFLGRFALQGAIFGLSAAIMLVIVSMVYAAASWGSLPTVGSGSGLTATAWNDLVSHVNQSIKLSGGSPAEGKVLTSDATGLATWQAPTSGKVLQVGYAAKNNSWSALTSGNNFYTVPGLSVVVTPTSVSSKVLLMLSLYGGTSSYQVKFRILRNGVPVILGAGEGGRPTTTGMINQYDTTAGQQYQVGFLGGTYMDTPSTTSAITYEIQMAAYDGQTVFLNRNNTWQNSLAGGYDATPVSSITVMEIAN